RSILTSICSANGYNTSTTNQPSNMLVQELSQLSPLLASPASPLEPIRKKFIIF
ncbi:17337_t:CDS:1, partial [Gigaspora margarita]